MSHARSRSCLEYTRNAVSVFVRSIPETCAISSVTAALVTETVFSLPGLGKLIVNGAGNRDYTLVLKGTIALSRARFPRGTLSPIFLSPAIVPSSCAMLKRPSGPMNKLADGAVMRMSAKLHARRTIERHCISIATPPMANIGAPSLSDSLRSAAARRSVKGLKRTSPTDNCRCNCDWPNWGSWWRMSSGTSQKPTSVYSANTPAKTASQRFHRILLIDCNTLPPVG